MTLQGVLLDIDGTLLLSHEAHAHAWADAYRESGYEIPVEQITPLVGMGGDKLMARLTPRLNTNEGAGKEIADRRQQIFLDCYLKSLKPTPGARDLVQWFKDNHLKITIATSAKDAELEGLLKQADVADLVDHTTTADDAKESKPDPDIVEAALKKSKLDAGEVLMLGDTPYDVESGERVGVGVIAVRTGGHGSDLDAALAVYADPADVLVHIDESPFGKRLAGKAG